MYDYSKPTVEEDLSQTKGDLSQDAPSDFTATSITARMEGLVSIKICFIIGACINYSYETLPIFSKSRYNRIQAITEIPKTANQEIEQE